MAQKTSKSKLEELKEKLDAASKIVDNDDSELKIEKTKVTINEKQKLFVKYYLALNGDGKAAAIQSGYSAKTAAAKASQMLTYPHIIKYLEEERQRLYNKIEISRDWIVQEYLELIHSAKCDEETKDRISWDKALKQLSKMYGYESAVKLDVQSNGTINIQYIAPNENEETEE